MTDVQMVISAGPLGPIVLTSDGESLTGLYFSPHACDFEHREVPVLREAHQQLRAYLAGERREFDLPLAPAGTDFQRNVWNALARIPYGQTISYAELAQNVGRPRASRAVGSANGANPISIIVPCHRVVTSQRTLGGYGGGLERKEWLLALERQALGLPKWSLARPRKGAAQRSPIAVK